MFFNFFCKMSFYFNNIFGEGKLNKIENESVVIIIVKRF